MYTWCTSIGVTVGHINTNMEPTRVTKKVAVDCNNICDETSITIGQIDEVMESADRLASQTYNNKAMVNLINGLIFFFPVFRSFFVHFIIRILCINRCVVRYRTKWRTRWWRHYNEFVFEFCFLYTICGVGETPTNWQVRNTENASFLCLSFV